LRQLQNEAVSCLGYWEQSTVNKLNFLALILELFAEIQKEHAIVDVKTVNIKFRFRSKNYIFWFFEIPDFEDKKQYLAYMSSHLSKL